MATRAWAATWIACGVLCAPAAVGQISFSEEGAARGFSPFLHTRGECLGVSAADYDGDGDIDIFVPTRFGTASRLYQNDGTGHFTDVALASGLASGSNDRMGLFFDYDGDRDLDLIIGNDHHGYFPGQPNITWSSTLRLFRQNADHTFTEVTAGSGLDVWLIGAPGDTNFLGMVGTITAADFDNDGDLDLYFGAWIDRQALFRNNGDGTFTDVTATSGDLTRQIDNWAAVAYDVNGDGLLDIYAAVDGADGEKAMLINQGDMSFVNEAAAYGLVPSFNDMGVAMSDPDNDGDLDIYVTEIHDATGNFPSWTNTQNVLFLDNGPGASPRFTDDAIACGVAFCDWGWGCDFADFDNDRDTDLAVTNGHGSAHFATDRSRLFENISTDPLAFIEVGVSAGFDDTALASGLIAADFNRDGRQDMVEVINPGNVLLYMNTSPMTPGQHNWLVVKPRRYDAGADHFSIGTIVKVWAGGEVMTRIVTTSWSILGQTPYEAHFGLGDAQKVDRIEVIWPDGRRRVVLNNGWTNRVIELTPGPRGVGAALPE
ncbi:MAG: CRTAC1 family protein [Phycisphaerales bacterium]